MILNNPDDRNDIKAIRSAPVRERKSAGKFFKPTRHADLIDAVQMAFEEKKMKLVAVAGILNKATNAALIEFIPLKEEERSPSLVVFNDNSGRHSMTVWYGIRMNGAPRGLLVPYKSSGMRHTNQSSPERFAHEMHELWVTLRHRNVIFRKFQHRMAAPERLLQSLAMMKIMSWAQMGRLAERVASGDIPVDASFLYLLNEVSRIIEQGSPLRIPEKKHLATVATLQHIEGN